MLSTCSRMLLSIRNLEFHLVSHDWMTFLSNRLFKFLLLRKLTSALASLISCVIFADALLSENVCLSTVLMTCATQSLRLLSLRHDIILAPRSVVNVQSSMSDAVSPTRPRLSKIAP